MPVGEAVCPYCASVVQKSQALVSGELETRYDELTRHRQEDATDSNSIDVAGVTVALPSGFRPIFYHDCKVARHRVTLYADNNGGGKVQS